MELSSFKHCLPIQIRFNDIDRVNHVNNAMYHTYIELGRVQYFNQVLDRTVDWNSKGFVLARTEIDYKKPIHLRDKVFCYTKLGAFKNKSFTLLSCITKIDDNGTSIICAEAVGTLVCMDFENASSMEIPENWKELFLAYEKK